MIGCRCKVGDGLSRAVLITRKLSGVVFISPHAKKAVMEKPRMWAKPSSGLALDTEGAPVLEACSSDGFKRAFPEISFNLITGAVKARNGTHTENELRWL